MSQLDDILEAVGIGVRANLNSKTPQIAKQQIKDLMLELIGKDEDEHLDDVIRYRHIRNTMRGELRKRVEEL